MEAEIVNVLNRLGSHTRHLTPRHAVEAAAARVERPGCEVAVIGAGPYGLAVAAHLRAAGIETRTFGRPMSFWREHMPRAMVMRSPWRGSHIADPGGRFTQDRFAQAAGIAPRDQFSRQEFLDYGLWFQRRAVPDLDSRLVARLEPARAGYRLVLEDGESVIARRVVLALGLANQALIPPEFDHLPGELVSHTADHADFAAFRGRRVVVVGRGQSACESAALLSEAGAGVELVARGGVRWIGRDPSRSAPTSGLAWALRKAAVPPSEVGPPHLNWLIEAPWLYRRLPEDVRESIAARCLLPAASAWLRARFDRVRVTSGVRVISARETGGKVELRLSGGRTALADHVLLGTGFHVDIAKYGLLPKEVLERIERTGGSPRLDDGYQSSLPGLHFVGSSSVASHGPLMRFVWGSRYTTRRLTQALRRGRP